MEITLEALISIAGLFLGGSGGAFFMWKWQRKKAMAEAKQAEIDATKELQDVYQQLINDIKADREEQKAYINELKDDRNHLRRERDDLRKRQDDLEETVRKLKHDVDRNGRQLEFMVPLLCGRKGCTDRMRVAISDIVEHDTERPHEAEKEIEPLTNSEL